MSGALLQLVARGHEDTHLMVEKDDGVATNFFRQAYKRHTPFSTQTIELDAPPLEKVFGETMKFTIPRKGDLLRGVSLAITMKHDGSGTTYFPAEELIEEASLIAGMQVIDRVTGEWIRIRRELFDKGDKKAAYRRLVDFHPEDHSTKTLWLHLPFFIEATPFPLIAAQFHNLELSLSFKSAVRGIDPLFQPRVAIFADFVFLDDSERSFFSKEKHALLIEQLHIQDDRVVMQQAEYTSSYENFSLFPQVYKNVTGAGTPTQVVLSDRLFLASPPAWQGLTSVQYDLKADAGHVRFRSRFMLPATGSVGVSWMDTSPGNGYSLKFETVGNDLVIYVYRERKTIAVFRKTSAWSDSRTSIRGPGVPLTLQGAWARGEAWINLNLDHDIQRRLDGIQISFDIEGYGVGEYWAEIPPTYKQSHFISVVEGVEPLNTRDVITTLSVFGDSTTTEVLATDFSAIVTTIRTAPIVDNFTFQKTQLFFRHPVKYLVWTTSPQSEFAKFSTGPLGNDSNTHDPTHSASILFNNHERYGMMPAVWYNVSQPMQYTETSPSTGIHLVSFCMEPFNRKEPTGSANFSRMASVVLFQRYKRANMSVVETSSLLESDTEMMAEGLVFDRLRIYGVCWNILRIEGGLCGMAYAS